MFLQIEDSGWDGLHMDGKPYGVGVYRCPAKNMIFFGHAEEGLAEGFCSVQIGEYMYQGKYRKGFSVGKHIKSNMISPLVVTGELHTDSFDMVGHIKVEKDLRVEEYYVNPLTKMREGLFCVRDQDSGMRGEYKEDKAHGITTITQGKESKLQIYDNGDLLDEMDTEFVPVWTMSMDPQDVRVNMFRKQQAKETKEDLPSITRMGQCLICMEREIKTVLLPCGHLVACGVCVQKIGHCPKCRAFVAEVHSIFA
jgi:hypothetical protein